VRIRLAFYACVFVGSLVFVVGFITLILVLYVFGVSLQDAGLGVLPVAGVLGVFVLPCVVLALVVMQGIRGRLPGTRKDREDNQAMQVDAPASRR